MNGRVLCGDLYAKTECRRPRAMWTEFAGKHSVSNTNDSSCAVRGIADEISGKNMEHNRV